MINKLKDDYKTIVAKERKAEENAKSELEIMTLKTKAMKDIEDITNEFMSQHTTQDDIMEKNEARRAFHSVWVALYRPLEAEGVEFMRDFVLSDDTEDETETEGV